MRQRATALIIRDKKILLIREGGYWYTPGGGIEEGESHEEAIARECKEEIGVDVLASHPYFVFDTINIDTCTPQRNYCYLVEIQGEPNASTEIDGIVWLSYEEVCAQQNLIPSEKELIFDRLVSEELL